MARVLVVDDVALNRDLVVTLLRYAGHDLAEAGDGLEALDRARDFRPDLVVCDILMPRMDGYEFVRRLRGEPAIAQAQVVFYTATFLEQEARVLAAACGVKHVLSKPCEPEEILATVQAALSDGSLLAPMAAAEPGFDRDHLRLVTDKLVQKAQQLEQANGRLSALIDLGVRLASERRAAALLELFCDGVRTLFGARLVLLSVLDHTESEAMRVVVRGDPGSQAEAIGRLQAELAAVSEDSGPSRFDAIGGSATLRAMVHRHLPDVRSALRAPVVSLRSRYGWILLVDRLDSASFDADDQRTLAVQAAQVGRFYENGNLYAQVQQQVGLLQAQADARDREAGLLRLEHDVARALVDADSMDAGVSTVLQAICASQRWDLGRLWQVDASAGVLRLAVEWHAMPPDASANVKELLSGEGLAGRVWRTGEPLWIADLHAEPRLVYRAVLPQDGPACAALFPLFGGGRVAGVLSFMGREPRAPDQRIQASVRVIGDQISQFVQRKRAEQRIGRLHRVASVMSEINALTVRVKERDELFRDACRIAIDTGRFKMAWIGVLHADPARIEIVAGRHDGTTEGYFERMVSELQRHLSTGSPQYERLVVRQQPVVVNDIAASPWMALRELLLQAGARSVIALPLVDASVTQGVMMLYADDEDFFDDDEIKLLRELAGDLSFAMGHLRQAEQINHLAYYDALTGHANSTLFNERVVQLLDTASAGHAHLALGVLDIDRFKSINDVWGRHTGDALLRQLAARLQAALGDRGRLARVGPDQFGIVIPNAPQGIELQRTLNDLYAICLGAAFVCGEATIHVAARLGVALSPRDGADAETLFRNAEAAVKRAKRSAERVLLYDAQVGHAIAEKIALEMRLRDALARQRFVLHYQPKVDAQSRCIVGVEALIRWQDPEVGLVPPFKFIPLMEESGLIVEVGSWALRQAAADRRRWVERGLSAPHIAVNVSAVQLRRSDFVDTVLAALGPAAGEAGIDIEITESAAMEEVEDTIAKLKRLRAHGIELAIDDFGTGYSSLAYLSKLPAQVLKIDRAFTMAMHDDPNAMTLVSTMVSLAHAMRMVVVAEGVETEAQAETLRHLRCDQLQGYLISRPVPERELAAMLESASVGSDEPIDAAPSRSAVEK